MTHGGKPAVKYVGGWGRCGATRPQVVGGMGQRSKELQRLPCDARRMSCRPCGFESVLRPWVVSFVESAACMHSRAHARARAGNAMCFEQGAWWYQRRTVL